MTQRSLSVLIVLNAVLLAAIALTFGPVQPAKAQIGGGSYLMLAGNTSQASQQVIYIMETRSGRLVGFTINSANGDVKPVGTREISKDLTGAGDGR